MSFQGQLRDQSGHFGMGVSGLVLGTVLVLLTDLPPWVSAMISAVPGFSLWWLRELQLQWPISRSSDMRLDTAFYYVGIVVAMTGTALLETLL